jgi:hypothetical protein
MVGEVLASRNRSEVLKIDEAWYREARRVFDEILNDTKTKFPLVPLRVTLPGPVGSRQV